MGNDQKLGRWGRLAPLSSSSSSMAGTDAAEGSSLVTLDLPKEPLAELANVVDLYQSIFGITPDVSAAAKSQWIDESNRSPLNSIPSSPHTQIRPFFFPVLQRERHAQLLPASAGHHPLLGPVSQWGLDRTVHHQTPLLIPHPPIHPPITAPSPSTASPASACGPRRSTLHSPTSTRRSISSCCRPLGPTTSSCTCVCACVLPNARDD